MLIKPILILWLLNVPYRESGKTSAFGVIRSPHVLIDPLDLLLSSAILTPCLLRDPLIPEHCSLSKSHSAIQWNSISVCFYGRLAKRMYNIPYGALHKRSWVICCVFLKSPQSPHCHQAPSIECFLGGRNFSSPVLKDAFETGRQRPSCAPEGGWTVVERLAAWTLYSVWPWKKHAGQTLLCRPAGRPIQAFCWEGSLVLPLGPGLSGGYDAQHPSARGPYGGGSRRDGADRVTKFLCWIEITAHNDGK